MLLSISTGSLITAVVILLIVGMILYFIYQYAPIPPMFKTAINILAFIFVLVYLLNMLGLWKM